MIEIDGMIEKVGNDIRPMLGLLPTSSTREQVRLLEMISVTAEYVSKEIGKILEFERTLEAFNRYGAKYNPPFGALRINGRVLLANYTSALGTPMNGVVVANSFIASEVALRWGWRGYKND